MNIFVLLYGLAFLSRALANLDKGWLNNKHVLEVRDNVMLQKDSETTLPSKPFPYTLGY